MEILNGIAFNPQPTAFNPRQRRLTRANGEGVDESYSDLIRASMIRSIVHSTAMDCKSLRGRG
jgi:hypothetical protein